MPSRTRNHGHELGSPNQGRGQLVGKRRRTGGAGGLARRLRWRPEVGPERARRTQIVLRIRAVQASLGRPMELCPDRTHSPLQAPPFAHTVSPVTKAQLPQLMAFGLPGCALRASSRPPRPTVVSTATRTHGALDRQLKRSLRTSSRLRTPLWGPFPIRRMRPSTPTAERRALDRRRQHVGVQLPLAVGPGPRRWSTHAYGQAIDVNPVENPYLEGGDVILVRAAPTSIGESAAGDGRSRRALVNAFAASVGNGAAADRHARLPALSSTGG